MSRLIIAIWMLSVSFLWGAQLTDDARSVQGALQALASATNVRINSSSVASVAKGYDELSRDAQYKNAHPLYRLLAAMTLVGDENLLQIVDQIWASGLEKKNHFLQEIGYQWGEKETNSQEKRIYRARFDLEVKRHSAGLASSHIFARQQDWAEFFATHPSTTAQAASTYLQRANWYAQALWAVDTVPQWHVELLSLALQPSGVIKPLTFKDRQQTMYGDSNAQPSMLHAGAFYASFPQVMVIGSHKAPSGQANARGIFLATQVAPHCHVVIGQPTVLDDPVLRPHYGLTKEEMAKIQNKPQETQTEIRELDGKRTQKKIIWRVDNGGGSFVAQPVQPSQNDGSLKDLATVGENRYGGYALTVWAIGQGAYYYCIPNVEQMEWIKGFLQTKSEGFTFEGLVKDVAKCPDVEQRIKDDLARIQANPTEFFRQ